MTKIFLHIIFCILYLTIAVGQEISIGTNENKEEIKISAFLDVFYAYDFNQPQDGKRQYFFYNHNRHNEFNLNLGYLKLAYNNKKLRANLALQSGTYPNDNYASEPGLLKALFEANVGYALNSKNNLWMDVGIFASHIGFESAISQENWTLSRSMLAENSPYYLTGAKLTYKPTARFEYMALICNGWQHIQKIEGNSLPSFGTQIKYFPKENIELNWSTFIGTDDPDSSRRMRYFNNFYTKFQLNKRIGFIAGMDLGMQQITKNSMYHNAWFSPILICRFAFTDHWAAAFRAEYYEDLTGIIIPLNNNTAFETMGWSLNLDYNPTPMISYRVEGRSLNGNHNLFTGKNNNSTSQNFCILGSVAVNFSRMVR